MSISILEYLRAHDNKVPQIEQIEMQTYVPTITDIDYQIGYVERHFVQKTNDKDSFIYEVNKSFKNTILANPMFQVQTIKWRLTGSPQEILDSNKKSINIVNASMPKLAAYLPNLLQFAKIN